MILPANVSIVIPALNEAEALPELVPLLARLEPKPAEILLVDGGSNDATLAIAREAGWRTIENPRGRAVQINTGVEQARGSVVCVLHADTHPPSDMVRVIAETMSDPKIALASFMPIIRGPEKTRWGTTFHNFIKTWYAPAIMRPHLFLRGVRLLFGDHAMFFRRADFLAVGGCDPGTPVMEEADLCITMARLGRVKLVRRAVYTSDRRIAAWGPLKANWIYLKMGIMWCFGARARLGRNYPDVR